MCSQYDELFKLWEENYSAEKEAEYKKAEDEAEEYWEDYDNAILEARISQYNEVEEEAPKVAEPKGEYTVVESPKKLWDMSGDDSSLDSRYH